MTEIMEKRKRTITEQRDDDRDNGKEKEDDDRDNGKEKEDDYRATGR